MQLVIDQTVLSPEVKWLSDSAVVWEFYSKHSNHSTNGEHPADDVMA